MDPRLLIDSIVEPGLPAPVWFIQLFKVLGFSLHEVPMNLWYAGVITAMLLYTVGGENARRFAARLMTQMPIIIAVGVNFGIVPLLFIQVGYAKIFYPATVLMAWFWFAIIIILTPAYYGVYVYAFGLQETGGKTRPTGQALARWKRVAGWCSAVGFLVIGFLFANGLSLVENIDGWSGLWQAHSVDGAATGTALNVIDWRFWPRWLLMFGIALTTTAAWVAFDAAWFGRGESDEYHAWARDFSWKLATIGVVWFVIAGAWYSFGTWPRDVLKAMFLSPWVVVTLLTIGGPAATWGLLSRAKQQGTLTRGWASLIGLVQFGFLAINAISRQVVQNLEIEEYFAITSQKTDTQWSAMALFLVSFVIGAGIVAWLIWQVAKLPAEPDAV